MHDNQQNKFIELKVHRDLGAIITDYFSFIKQNLKKFSNIFVNYNGLFLIGLLVVSYFLVSGFIGMITYSNNYEYLEASERNMEETYMIYLVIGGALFFFIFLAVAIMNYSLAGSYMIKYEEHQGNSFDKKEVWNYFKKRIGMIFVFTVLMILIFIVVYIAGIVLLFIPLLGFIAYYIIMFAALAWFGVSFFAMIHDDKDVMDSFREGWQLVRKNFWKSVGVNFILGLLNGMLSMVALIIPGVIIGLYTFHVVENDVDVSESIVATIIYTIGFALYLIILVYGQCLSQFVNGFLFYSLHEETYNTNTRSKIGKIGNLEQ
jgi:MFS family permease